MRDDSEGNHVLSRSRSLTNSLDVFRGNHAELKRFLVHVVSPSVAVHMWAEQHRYRLDYAQREAARLLHNYVAAAFSLVDSTRAFVEKHYFDTKLLDEYEGRVKRDFAEAPLHRFLQQLRNYTMHNQLPPMKAINSFKKRDDGGTDFDNSFWLDAEKLWERGDWTGKAREYLESMGEKAKLEDIVDAYEPVVTGFHGWLTDRIRQEHEVAIEETLELERHMKEAELRAYGDSRNTKSLRPSEESRPEHVLASLVGPSAQDDWDTLYTLDDVIVSLYASVSFTNGGLPNVDRFRCLFLTNAQLIELKQDGAYLMDIEGYVDRFHRALIEGGVTEVSEYETARRSYPLGDIAHVLSFHETRYVEDGEEKKTEGMYDLHLVKAGERWIITSMHLCDGYSARLERLPQSRNESEPSQED